MILDKKSHRKMLLDLIGMANFPGGMLQEAAELQKSIENAIVMGLGADAPEAQQQRLLETAETGKGAS